MIEPEKLLKAATILKTISHPTRLAIIGHLETNERLSVTEICALVNCEQSLLSHHLSNMKLRGLLSSTREGLNVYYSLKQRELSKILSCIENCDCNL
jgi:DNA-binding transcriptional ArsR family regulator